MFNNKRPFADYVKSINDFYLEQKKELEALSPMALEAPCDLCGGRGYLLAKVTYSKMATPSCTFINSKNIPVVAHRMECCPACATFGVNKEKLILLLENNCES